jgi:arsenite methyltransferase
MSINEAIQGRYSQAVSTGSMGCSNLSPWFNIQPGDSVLDLGCGSGRQAISLLELVGPYGTVDGLDITPAMIDAAKQLTDSPNISFTVGSIDELPYNDNQFNVVISNCVINHSTDKERVYRELFRTLKPGGHFLVGDVMSVGELPESVSSDPEAIAACYGGAIPADRYLDIIRRCGFTGITVLHSRTYVKEGFQLESITIQGVKP